MSEKISYCGLYCGACPSYQKKTCLGCRSNNKKQNRISKWGCKIRRCCIELKKIQYCGDCEDFPCKEIERKLINSHPGDARFNYRHKITDNMEEIAKLSLEKWSKEQEILWTCQDCGQPLMFYYNQCSSCGKENDPQAT